MDGDTGGSDRLASERIGAGDTGPPLVLLHGFAQDRRCWGPLAVELSRSRPVVAVDLPGHGGSADLAADLDRTVDLLEATVADLGDSLDVLGYSMGGRVGLTWACARPDRIARLVTIGATAGIEDPARRAERRALDEERAGRIESAGVETFLDEWLELPMFAGLPEWARFGEERRSNTAAGLAASLRLSGTGSMRPVWDDLASVARSGRGPELLALAGRRDPDYVRLADRLARTVGGTARAVEDAGHAAHLERPGPTISLVGSFLGD